MATVEDIKKQARKAQRQLADARKRADEDLGKRLRELAAGGDKLDREAQVERAHEFLDGFFAEKHAEDEQHDERQEHGEYGKHADGQQYGGSEYT